MNQADKSNTFHYNKNLRPFANTNRKNMTKAEACLWKFVIGRRQMMNYQFRRQRPILNYIADFMCKELMLIIEVDGTNVKGKSVNDMSSFLKGTPGTKVKLKVKRPLVEDLIDIEIIRKEIKVSSVPYHAEIDKGIGYIKLTSFTQTQ